MESFTVVDNVSESDIGAGRPHACITSISREHRIKYGFRPEYEGELLYIYPGYTEFRPIEKNQNVSLKQFTGMKSYVQKTNKEKRFSDALHFKYLLEQSSNRLSEKNNKPTTDEIESFIYPSRPKTSFKERTPRGIITCISSKSARRLKKLLARMFNLDLWIDLTFSDDVFNDPSFASIIKKAHDCLMEFERYIKSLGLHYVWKKEIKPRLSGRMLGQRVPHYHVSISGLSDIQKKNWEALGIQLLTAWVSITRTKNPSALKVALNYKNGVPSSFRLIQSTKMALLYIGKYFSKTEDDKSNQLESIGRAWGHSKDLPLASPIVCSLFREESIIIRRMVRKACHLKKNKKFVGCLEQIKSGYATFLFITENFLLRLLNRYVNDPLKVIDEIPF